MIPMRALIIPCVSFMAQRFNIVGGRSPCVMIGAIGGQESGFEARDQLEAQNGKLVPGEIGPATGFYQFELGGGIKGVMTHRASEAIARFFVDRAELPWDRRAVWESFVEVSGDELATVFARLLLLTDPQALPPGVPSSEEEAFLYYLRNWRPGAWFRNAEGSEQRLKLRAKWKTWWAASISAYDAATSSGEGEAPSVAQPNVPTVQELIVEIRERLDVLEGLMTRR